MKQIKSKTFANGKVYLLHTEDGYPIETTDTFLPFYTKDAIGRNQNALASYELGSRAERWMVGVSVMSGCPVRCKFCATAKLKKWRNLTAEEIVAQVKFIVDQHPDLDPKASKEFKINYTRMGEPGLNVDNVKKAIAIINELYPNVHHYVSTIGMRDADYSWVKDNITLQVSVHSFDEEHRNWLIPYNRKMTLAELGQIRTKSNLKTTINLTLVDESDFDIAKLKQWFDPKFFFVKLSPINKNDISEKNNLGDGVIKAQNLV
jgi:adenine C2-methylase RlmN of 23S rRNA A2503 and tRNA A37